MNKVNLIKQIASILATFLATFLIAYATFPAQLNNFSAGNVIRSADWNAIEAEIGTRIGTTATGTTGSLNWVVRNAMFATSSLRVGNSATTTIAGDTGTSTFVNGISISAGCFLFNSTCLTNLSAANPSASVGLSAVNGTAATFMRSDGAPALDQTIAPTMTGLWKFTTGGLISLASSTMQILNAGTLTVPSLTSAITLTNGSGDFAEYAGTSCTNQFVRSLSALGAATCATVGTTDVAGLDISDDTNLSGTFPIILTGDTLSFGGISTSTTPTAGHITFWNSSTLLSSVATGTLSGTYPVQTSAARYVIGGDVALSLAFGTTTANTWTDNTQTFGTIAGTINASGAAEFRIPENDTLAADGAVTTDDTTGQFRWRANSTEYVQNGYRYATFGYATSSWTGTTTVYIGPAGVAQTWDWVYCETDAGTVGVSIYDGTNRMNYIPTASTTINQNDLSTNNSFTLAESRRVDFGTPATAPKKVSCTAAYTITAD